MERPTTFKTINFVVSTESSSTSYPNTTQSKMSTVRTLENFLIFSDYCQPLYNVNAHHAELHQDPTYIARLGFTGSIAWKEEKGGHTLFRCTGKPNNPDGPADPYGFITTCGVVLNSKFFVGTTGAWTDKWGQPISAAKYGFLLGCPGTCLSIHANHS